MTFNILTLNSISDKGLKIFSNKYRISNQEDNPDAILVRSSDMLEMPIPASLKVVGRAGVGVNNIPVKKLTHLGIPVLNAPGANANAVKELVITGMLLACRHICKAWDYTRNLKGNDEELERQVEENKKRFSGMELPGKTLGVIGLGHVGVQVANTAINLGMKVIGFDNAITVQNAWKLSANVQQAHTLAEVCLQSDFITLHVPLTDKTRNLIDSKLLQSMKTGVVILNFARDGIINNFDLINALESGKVGTYVMDFPSSLLQKNPSVISLPHLGASTKEAEENCAIMVSEQVKNFLERGEIKNSVNFPDVSLPPTEGHRFAIANLNVPNIIAQVTSVFSSSKINILDMINKSRDDIAYNLIDTDTNNNAHILQAIRAIDGVVSARKIEYN